MTDQRINIIRPPPSLEQMHRTAATEIQRIVRGRQSRLMKNQVEAARNVQASIIRTREVLNVNQQR